LQAVLSHPESRLYQVQFQFQFQSQCSALTSDAEERAATAKRHAARIAAAALKRAEHAARVAANREKRARRLASTESYAHRARERARAWRQKKRLETPAEGAET
jgi:hypothetical protein